ncbi:MAG: hypothetical protein SGBAC_011247, partial [Bacillariaceae sp.]
TFAANIEFRNDAIKAIRDGITCGPTGAPTTPGGSVTSSPVAPPTLAPVTSTPPPSSGDNLVGDTIEDPIDGDGGDSTNEDDLSNEDNDEENTSNLLFGGDIENTDVPVGLIVTLALGSIILCMLLALCCYSKRGGKKAQNPRMVEAICKVAPTVPDGYDDELNKVYDVALDDEDSVDTEESDGIIYFVEDDIEQKSSSN